MSSQEGVYPHGSILPQEFEILVYFADNDNRTFIVRRDVQQSYVNQECLTLYQVENGNVKINILNERNYIIIFLANGLVSILHQCEICGQYIPQGFEHAYCYLTTHPKGSHINTITKILRNMVSMFAVSTPPFMFSGAVYKF